MEKTGHYLDDVVRLLMTVVTGGPMPLAYFDTLLSAAVAKNDELHEQDTVAAVRSRTGPSFYADAPDAARKAVAVCYGCPSSGRVSESLVVALAYVRQELS